MEPDNGTQELEVQAGDKKIKVRGSDILNSLIGMIVCSGLAYIIFTINEHRAEASSHSGTLSLAIQEQTKASKEQAQATRYMACIISEDTKDRKAAKADCRENARLP